jgi:hypothetical protein
MQHSDNKKQTSKDAAADSKKPSAQGNHQKDKLTTEDLKGKKVDGDPEKESDRPIEQKRDTR